MADNTKQFCWIVTIQQNLEWLFAQDPTIFVAGDLLWYPVEGNNTISCAPDVMVVFGRPKGDPCGICEAARGSYQQWNEDNIAPQVVFEILSPSNTKAEMNRKLDGKRFLTYVEIAQQAEQIEQRAERLAERLRELGIDPEQI